MNNLVPPGNITETSMTLSPTMTFDEWTATGKTLGVVARAAAWWIGDWLNFGELQYGEAYTQAMEVTGLDYQYLADCKWVASKVSLRNENLSWWHHRVVASLSPDEQKTWLDQALAGEWTVRQLALNMQGDSMNLDALTDMDGDDLDAEIDTPHENAWQLLPEMRDIDRARRFGVALNHFTEQDANIPQCGWPARLVFVEPEHIMRSYLAAMNG